MKKGIHPKYHVIRVRRTNGEEEKMFSTWSSPDALLVLDIDPLVHSAWTGGTGVVRGDAADAYNKRYGKLNFLGKPKGDA